MKRLKKQQKLDIAQAIGNRLEKMDWNVWERKDPCPQCAKHFVGNGKFCPECGHQLPLREGDSPAMLELLDAFKAGLKVYDKIE